MKILFLIFSFTNFALASDPTHTCYARYGSPESEIAVPCKNELELNLSAANIKEVETMSDKFECEGAQLNLSLSTMGKESYRVTLSIGKQSNWTVYELVDQKFVWIGLSSPSTGFAEVSCIRK